jgi:hypothetical protein
MLGAVLVVVMTAPTLTRLTTVGRFDTNDGLFSIWNIAWIDHALLTAPSKLLDANIFYPHTGTLAYSELNLVAGIFGLPWYAATHKAVAALNGAVGVALWLAFLTMWALVRRLSGSDGAGLVSATAFTFCPYVGARTAHIQLLMIFVFPLVLLAFHRLRDAPTPRRGVELGLALAIAALSCGYYGIFAGCALAWMTLVYADRSPRYWSALGTAAAVVAIVVWPVYRAFSIARAESGGAPASYVGNELPEWSANLSAYLASSSIAHEWWLPALRQWRPWKDVLFPGIGLLALAGVGTRVAWRSGSESRRLLVAYLVLAALAVWASFGPALGLYRLLEHIVPGMGLIRAPGRFGVLVACALSVVAGFGAARLSNARAWVSWVLVVVIAAELGIRTTTWGWPSWPLSPAPAVSRAYRKLPNLPPGVLVEFLFPYQRATYHFHARAMYWSTYHWLPLVNGYSDIIPQDFDQIAVPINGFPDPASFAILKAKNVRYVLWHADDYVGAGRDVLHARIARYERNLRPIVVTPDTWLYEIVQWPDAHQDTAARGAERAYDDASKDGAGSRWPRRPRYAAAPVVENSMMSAALMNDSASADSAGRWRRAK